MPIFHAPSHGDAPTVKARPDVLACSDCDALYRRVPLDGSQQLRCLRCSALLGRGHHQSPAGLFALALAALILFIIANVEPIVDVDLRGIHNAASLPGALVDTWNAGEALIAVLGGAVAFVFPLLVILLHLYVLLPAFTHTLPPAWLPAMRALNFSRRWSMVEVLMLAAFVAIVKIASLASISPGAGMFAFAVLALLLAALESAGQQSMWHFADPVPAPLRVHDER